MVYVQFDDEAIQLVEQFDKVCEELNVKWHRQMHVMMVVHM